MKRLVRRWAWVLFLFAVSSDAYQVNSLYTMKIPVKSQSAGERKHALPDALEQTLIKVSGNSEISENETIAAALAKPESLLTNYTYTNQRQRDSLPLLLTVNFDPEQINALLKHSGQGIWSQERSLTIVWLAIDRGNEKQLLAADSVSKLPTEMQHMANARGLPIIFPLLDLVDMEQVSLNDVMAPFPWNISQASKRYKSEAELIGKLYQVVNEADGKSQWHGQWLLLQNGAKLNWQTKGETQEVVIRQMINEMADAMGRQYAVTYSPSRKHHLTVAIFGIKDLADYGKVSKYLRGLSQVSKLELQSLEKDRAIFDLSIMGADTGLVAMIDEQKVLQPVVGEQTRAHLSYRLIS